MKTYFVCQSYEWFMSKKKYYQAETNIDNLSCEAIYPILKIRANNKKEAIQEFRQQIKPK